MPPPLPPPILLRILHSSTSPSEPPTIDTLTHLWLSLRPVCRAFRAEIEDVFLTQHLPHLEIRVAVYSQDVYQICDPKRILPQGERAGRGVDVEKRGFKPEMGEMLAPRTVPDDILFNFSHTTTTTTNDGDSNGTETAIFTPATKHASGSENDMNTAMALASLASRFISRLMVKKPTHVISWYETVNDVFLPGLRVDLVRGWVEVEWKGLVGGMLGEERGVESVRRGLVGVGKGRRGLCKMGGGGMLVKAGPATRSGVIELMHESPAMDAPMAKKRRRDGKGKSRDGVRRRFGRDKGDIDFMKQSSPAVPVVIDFDPVRTPTSPPSRTFDFDFDGNVDMDVNLDLLSEPDWEHVPPPPQPLEACIPPYFASCSYSFPHSKSNDFGFNFSSSSPPPLPFSVSPSPPSSPAISPATPSSHSPPQPPSPSPTLYPQYPSHYSLPTPPPPPIPANTLNWDIDPARLEARRRRVAHLFRKFCRNGGRDIGVGNVIAGENDIGREMGEEIRAEMEREMGYRGWIMGEWCAVERVQSLRMEVGG